ncbi:MAG: hypothetical protein HN595_01465, partial [Flavobacteriaceae bacterium]|nr:hypothetical protein [Flavobacteriaceae bacterium]
LKSLTEINELANENINNIEIFPFSMQLNFFKKMYNLQDADLLKTKLKNIKLAWDNKEYINQEKDINLILELLIYKINTAKSVKSNDFDLDNLLTMNNQFTSIVEKLKEKSIKNGGGLRSKKDKLKQINSDIPQNIKKILVEIIYDLRDKPNINSIEQLWNETTKTINNIPKSELGDVTIGNLYFWGGWLAVIQGLIHSITILFLVGLAFASFGVGLLVVGLSIAAYNSYKKRTKANMKALENYVNENVNVNDPQNKLTQFFTEAFDIIKDTNSSVATIVGGKRKSSKRNAKKNSNKKTRNVAKHKKKHSKNSVATQKKRRRRKISRRNKSKGGKYRKKRSKKNRK